MNTLRYARKVTKGDLLYHDYLLIDKIEKKVIYIKEEETGKQSLLNYKKKTASSFTKIIEKYKEKGFELIEKDGADDRIRQADVIQGIDLHVDVSTYADYCKVRPERGSYFSFEKIQRAVDYYLDDEISFFKLRYWCQFFALAVEESFSYPLTSQNTFQYAVIKCLSDHMITGKRMVDDEEIKEDIRKVMPEIYSMRDKYYKMIGLGLLKGE